MKTTSRYHFSRPTACAVGRFVLAATVLALVFVWGTSAQIRRKVIINQDCSGPGGSNMQTLATLIQSPQVEVLGVTIVTGNQWRDEEVVHALRLLEVMGRYAGWIALYAGVAGGGDVILIPEIPYDIMRVCDKINRRDRAGRHFSIVVVAEGAFPKGGHVSLIGESLPGEARRLGGLCEPIARDIARITPLDDYDESSHDGVDIGRSNGSDI